MVKQKEQSQLYANSSAASRAARKALGKTARVHIDFALIPDRAGRYRWAPGPTPAKLIPGRSAANKRGAK